MILAIETSDILCSLAFWDKGRTLLEYNLEMPQQHATLVGSLAEQGLQFLQAAERIKTYSAQDLELLTVSIGPGSFTGLRIGLSFAQGFCAARNLPICGVSNHQLLAAQRSMHNGPLFTIIEARRNEVYLARHSVVSPAYTRLEAHAIVAKDKLAVAIDQGAQLLAPRGLQLAQDVWQQLQANQVLIINQARYTAGRLAALGAEKRQLDGADDLEDLEPMYIRPFAGAS